ncbi:MAG: twin-arginine translocase TatA/TatE family subunit [Gemmatimonadetes bacterium]|nr:twin-arginine translocase TatA/TatE family subunit [Gemmatimonadota bacterium]
MPFNLGFSELLVILVIVLLVFGAKRLPEMGAAMGKGIREFKRSLKDVQGSIEGGSSDDLPAGGSSRHIEQTGRSGDPKKLSQ